MRQGGAYASLVEAQIQKTAEKLSIGIEQVRDVVDNTARSRLRRVVHGITAISRLAAAATKRSTEPIPEMKVLWFGIQWVD